MSKHPTPTAKQIEKYQLRTFGSTLADCQFVIDENPDHPGVANVIETAEQIKTDTADWVAQVEAGTPWAVNLLNR